MALTPRGYPYPLPSAALSAGANDLKALAEENDKRNQSAQSISVVSMPAGGSPQLLPVTALQWQDFPATYVGATTWYIPAGGRFRIFASFRYSSQEGAVNSSIGVLTRHNQAGAEIDQFLGSCAALNLGFVICQLLECDPGDHFSVQGTSGAGAVGGNLRMIMTLERTGPGGAGGPALLDELLERRDDEEAEGKPTPSPEPPEGVTLPELPEVEPQE